MEEGQRVLLLLGRVVFALLLTLFTLVLFHLIRRHNT